jgi:hypothetical protein
MIDFGLQVALWKSRFTLKMSFLLVCWSGLMDDDKLRFVRHHVALNLARDTEETVCAIK